MSAARIMERKVLIQEESIDRLLRENGNYINWLLEVGGQAAKDAYVAQLNAILARAPRAGTYATVSMNQLGTARFYPYTYSSPNILSISDPINLVFTNRANVGAVESQIYKYIFPPWLDTRIKVGYRCSRTQWVYVDNTATGGTAQWVKVNSTLAIGGCSFIRCHLRLFDGGRDASPRGIGEYTLANVHYEIWDWNIFDHVIQDWDNTQAFLSEMFEGHSPSFASKRMERLQPSGEVMQNVVHDGLATVIKLT